ncbi:sodium/hydrogen exchanger [Methanothermococcus okinawensis IH1]|uniref:Sodium/hydrogen exchanger n=2 Tax=Methanothermococcus okinawensis TaxID=155863 RepID=F8AJY4_METOI|nr:sodium/hydrogen exchanger [Methanothermococcus okinawensis IH1]
MFFIIISFIFIMPEILKRFNVPSITSVMLAGIIAGPYGLGLIQPDNVIELFSSFGAIFLMFLAGMEVDNETLRREFKSSIFISLFSLIIPAIGGYLIGTWFGLNFIGALLYAIIFSSHSVGIVYALMNELNLTKSKFGTTVLGSTILVDLISLIILSIIIRLSTDGQNFNVGYFITSDVVYIGALLLTIPYISKIIFEKFEKLHIKKIHFVIFIILISILIGEHLGLHPIIGAFITGIAISESLTKKEHDELLNKNLNAIGYGFFIPIFFFALGMNTNISVLYNLSNVGLILATIIGAVVLKVISGYISFKLVGYDKIKSMCGGLLTIPKISASLVAASVGKELGIISNEFFVAIVVLSLITSMIAPILVKNLVNKYHDSFTA